MTKGQEWNGVERLAQRIVQRTFEAPCSTPTPITEEMLRVRLEPLLDAAWEVVELHLPTDCRDSSICERCELRRKVATWR